MEEVTLKDVLNVVLDVKQELQETKQELREEMKQMEQGLNQRMDKMDQRMDKMDQRMDQMQKDIKEIKLEQVDTREIVKIIVDKIGEIDRKLDAQAKDKCIFHKTLVGAKSN